jgi:hypothetical protein
MMMTVTSRTRRNKSENWLPLQLQHLWTLMRTGSFFLPPLGTSSFAIATTPQISAHLLYSTFYRPFYAPFITHLLFIFIQNHIIYIKTPVLHHLLISQINHNSTTRTCIPYRASYMPSFRRKQQKQEPYHTIP